MFVNRQESEPQPALLEAAQQFFPDASFHPMTGFPDHVMCTIEEQTWAVRMHPRAATVSRVEWIADALGAAHAAGASGIPEWATVHNRSGQRALLHQGRVFDAITWLAGRPLNRYGTFELSTGDQFELPLPDSMSDETVLFQAVRTVAKVHTTTAEFARRADAPALRLHELSKAARQRYQQLRKDLGTQAESDHDVRRWLRCCNRILPATADRLADSPALAQSADCVTHSDLWPSRLQVEEGSLTGITGWQQAIASAPVLDLARLAARCARWNAETAEGVIASYTDVAPLSPEQRRLLPVIAGLDLAMVTGSMLLAAYDTRLTNDPVQSFIRSGILTSMRSLETLANVLEPAKPRAAFRRSQRSSEPRPRNR